MRCFSIVVIAGVWAVGCVEQSLVQDSGETLPVQRPPHVMDDQLRPELARQLIAQAAAITETEFDKLLIAPEPAAIENQTLSVILFSLDPFELNETNPAALRDFKYLTSKMPRRSQIAEVMMWQNGPEGYASIVQPEYITDCECQSDAATAQGRFTFEAPGVYTGELEFSARFQEGQWSIHEFRLARSGVKAVLSSDGVWKRMPPIEPVAR